MFYQSLLSNYQQLQFNILYIRFHTACEVNGQEKMTVIFSKVLNFGKEEKQNGHISQNFKTLLCSYTFLLFFLLILNQILNQLQ